MSIHREMDELSAYLDGELDATERRALDAHLTGCAECRSTLEALKATTGDLRSLPAPDVTPQQSWVLRAALRRARRPWLARYSRVVAAAAGVAAIATAISVASLGGKRFASTNGPAELALGRPTIVLTDTNFDKSSARALLFGSIPADRSATGGAVGTLAPGAGPQAPAYANSEGTGSGAISAPVAPKAVASPVDYSQQIHACEQQIFANARDRARALEYIVATYEKTPAFLLAYDVPADHPDRSEVWVVRRTDCTVLYFAQGPPQ